MLIGVLVRYSFTTVVHVVVQRSSITVAAHVLSGNHECLHAVNSSEKVPLLPQVLSFVKLAFIGRGTSCHILATYSIGTSSSHQKKKQNNMEGSMKELLLWDFLGCSRSFRSICYSSSNLSCGSLPSTSSTSTEPTVTPT